MTAPTRIVFARPPKPNRKPKAAALAEPEPPRIVKALSPQRIARLRRRYIER